MLEWNEPGDVFDVTGAQQLVDHVEDEQRLHPIVGETFPSFGEGDVTEAARMPDETAILGAMHGPKSVAPCPIWQALRAGVMSSPSASLRTNSVETSLAVCSFLDREQ